VTDTTNRTPSIQPVAGRSTELRTFMIADVRGYTRFTQEHGDDAGAELAMRFAALARESAAARGGEVLELRGDEAFAVFPSARQALRAAMELLERCRDAGEADPLFPLPVGIGLDAGEAVRVEGGFRGGAINLAARLCSLAGPGEVLASEGVVHLARRTEGLRYAERGLVELKGFVDPVRVIHVASGNQSPGEPLIAPLPPGALQTEAKLPIGGFLGSLPSGELIARDDELIRVLPSVDAVEQGSGQLVLLVGERGIGKTRLAQEITLKARDRGFVVATGRCYAQEQSIPFFPFLECLSMAHVATPLALRTQVVRQWPQLAHLLPVALLLDDLQWADEASVQLFYHIARTMRSTRLLIVGAYRDTELLRDAPLDHVIRDLMRERLADRVTVHRLSAEGTADFIASMIGDMEASEEFAEYVHRRTKGNPFFITEILRALAGRYRLVRELGAGGMGRVFQAVDTRTGNQVAAKIMFASRDVDLDLLLRFQQEGAVLSTLKHPNIVQVYSTFLEEHASVIIMELLQGQPLDKALGSGPLDFARIRRLLGQVTNALAYAHSKSIVHRDIKPDNIMVIDGDLVKITDFGIARIVRDNVSGSTMMGTGMTLGTPLYSAPEQIEGRKVDGRADVYALGTVLYQLVTGHPPFDGADPLTVAYKHVNQAPEPPREINADVPEDWEALILKALAKDPADRFQSAASMERAIAELSIRPEPTEGQPARAPSPSLVRVSVVGDASPIERHSDLVPAAAVSPEPRNVAIESDRPWEHAARSMNRPRHLRTALTMPSHAFRHRFSWILLALTVVLIAGGVWAYAFRPKSAPSFAMGSPVVGWGTRMLSARPLSYPDGAAVDTQRNVYVADELNNRIVKLGSTGALLDEWGSRGSEHGQFNSPGGVTVDASGNVYVADTNNGRVEEFSPTGAWLKSWGTPGSGSGQLSSPGAVIVDGAGALYVADTGNNRIQKWSTFGRDQIWAATPNRPLDAPMGLGLDAKGDLYVVNSGPVTSNIVEMSPSGKTVRIVGKLGIQSGRFNQPRGITIDPAGNLYVADFKNTRVQELTASGRFLRSWGPGAQGAGPFAAPVAVTRDATGAVYAVDAGANAIGKLSPGGQHFTP
jgi:serine/threonine protein kinase, bacterial